MLFIDQIYSHITFTFDKVSDESIMEVRLECDVDGCFKLFKVTFNQWSTSQQKC